MRKAMSLLTTIKSLYDLPVEFKHALIVTSPLVGLNEDIADQAIEVLRSDNRFHKR